MLGEFMAKTGAAGFSWDPVAVLVLTQVRAIPMVQAEARKEMRDRRRLLR